jgi:hypothetical protein
MKNEMKLNLLFLGLDGIFSWIVGIVALCLILSICYLIGQIGLQVRKGIDILKYLENLEKDSRAKGVPFSLNDKGVALKKDGQQKIWLPIVGIAIFYTCAFIFIPESDIKLGTLVLLVPAALGYFGVFLVPSLD